MRSWHFVFAFIFTLHVVKLPAQSDYVGHSKKQMDSLFHFYGKNKLFEPTMLEPTLMAIQYYPELKNTNIEFRYKNISTLMAARPKILSVFYKKSNRKYVIIISTNPNNHSHQLFQNMSLSSKTGILGHEFAHILDYEQQSGLGLVFFGIKYMCNKKHIERHTDEVAIQRGLGIAILDYNRHIKKSELLSRKYLIRKEKYYLSVAEIEYMLHREL